MNTTLTIKLPKKLRDEAKETAEVLGLPLTTVIQRQLKDFVEKREISFTMPVSLHRTSVRALSKDTQQKLARAKRLSQSRFVDL